MTLTNVVSMISSAMLHLMVVPAAEQVDSVADSISMEQISATFSEISSEISSVAVQKTDGASNGPMKGANISKSVRITFEEAVFGCEKELDACTERSVSEDCHGTGAKPGTSPETCPKCGGKGQVVYTQQSFFGTVQNVQTCPDCGGTGKIIKEKCPDCARYRIYFQQKEDSGYRFRQVLITDRVYASAKKENRV